MKIAIVRGAFLNQFEMQNFVPLAKRHLLTAFSSLKPVHDKVGLSVIKLPSPMDILGFTPILQSDGAKRIFRGILNRVFIDAHYLLGLEKKLQGFDTVHTTETYFHYTQQCLAAKRKGLVKKVVCSVSETIPFNNEGIWGRKKFKQRARKEVDLFLAWTVLAKEALITEGFDPKKIMVIPMGVDIRRFKKQKAKSKITKQRSKSLTILFVGRLEEEKGLREVLEAYKQLTISNPPTDEASQQLTIKLKIVGEGTLKDRVKQWIERNKQYNNVTIEQYNYQDIPKVYQAADIFVLPSKGTKTWQEHFGMVLVEAMASSLPIAATKSGAIPEVIGKCGLLVKEQDPEGLYKVFKRLVEDQSLRRKLGKMGRERAEKYFDSGKIARKIENVYEKVLAE